MIETSIREILRTVARCTWIIVCISCCLLTYFVALAFLKIFALLCCLCSSRHSWCGYPNKIEAKLYKWLLSFISCWVVATGYKVYEHGDDISSLARDRAILISNHLDSADVPILMHKCTNTSEVAENMMWIMDKSYRLTFLGWVAAGHGDFFIKQGKQFRESEMKRLSAHVKNVFHRRNRRWVVLFPEGGFLELRRKLNDDFTSQRGLPKLQHITLPRFGALTAIYSAFKECQSESGEAMPKWLIDVTMAYPPNQRFPTLSDVFLGRRLNKMEVNLFYRVYRISDIPFSDEAELTKWMYNLYYEKESMLDYFYKNGNFPTSAATSNSLCGIQRLENSFIRHSWSYYAKLHAFFLSTYVFLSFFFAMILRFFIVLIMKHSKTPSESK